MTSPKNPEATMYRSSMIKRRAPMLVTRQVGPNPGPCANEASLEQRAEERQFHALRAVPNGVRQMIR